MANISVIVPVYKVSAYLSRCVDSILEQTYSDLELILVDDESPDDCPGMCDNYAEKDIRIRVLHIQHGGLSAARNAGIIWALEYSDSQYISFVDSDDWVHPRYLEWLYDAIRGGNGTAAVGKYIRVNDGCVFNDQVSISTINPTQLYCEKRSNFIVSWGKLFPKEDFRGIRFPLGKIHEDEFTIWKIMFKYHEIAFIDVPIYAYYQRSDSIMGTWSPNRLVKIDAVKEQYDWILKNGNSEMIVKAKQLMVNVYAEEIKGMTQYDMPSPIIYEYRKALRGLIIKNRKQLPLLPYMSTYEIAWPIIRYVVSILRRVKHGAVRVMQILEKLAGEKNG